MATAPYNPYAAYDPHDPYRYLYGQDVPGDMPLPLPDPGGPGPIVSPPDTAGDTGQVPGGTPPTTPPTTPGATGTLQDQVQAILKKYPYGPEGLGQAEAELRALGISLQRNSAGQIRGRIFLPGGKAVDVIDPAEGQNWWTAKTGTGWGWTDRGIPGPEGAAGGTAGADLDWSKIAGAIDPSYLEPFNERSPNAPNLPMFDAIAPFQGPNKESVLSDPGYAFRKDQGLGAIANSAGAKGLLGSSGTVFDLAKFADQNAANEFENVWNRDFAVYNTDANNRLTKYRADTDAITSAYDRALANWMQRRDTFYANQSNPFSKLIDVARIGAGTAGA